MDHPAVHRVRAALSAAGASGEVRLLDASARTAQQAADQVGVDVGQIANSLVFDADGEPLLVLTNGVHRVDRAKVAALVGRRGSGAPTRTSFGTASMRSTNLVTQAAPNPFRRPPADCLRDKSERDIPLGCS